MSTETAPRKPLVAQLPAMVMSLIGLALTAAALWRLPEASWGERIWLVAYLAMFAIRLPYTRKTRSNEIEADKSDPADRAALMAVFLTMMILPLVHLGSPFLTVANFALPTWATVVGVLLLPGFLWLFWRSHADLGRNWSPGLELREGHTLVTAGVYARMRHPMYTAIWLFAIAQPLLIHNWVSGLLVVPAFAALYFLRVPKEEAMVRERFGSAYDEYAARTGRIWPSRLT